MKKWSVTVILVFVVLLAVVGIFLLVNPEQPTQKKTTTPSDPLREVVEGCLRSNAQKAIKHNFLNGGWFDPRETEEHNGHTYAYYFHLGQNLHPTHKNMEHAIRDFLREKVPSCVDNQNERTTSTAGPMSFFVESGEKLFLKASFPHQITIDRKSEDFKTYEIHVNVNLRAISSTIEQLMQQPKEAEAFLEKNSKSQGFTYQIQTNQNIKFFTLTWPLIPDDDPVLIRFAIKE